MRPAAIVRLLLNFGMGFCAMSFGSLCLTLAADSDEIWRPADAAAEATPIASRQSIFSIPFRVNRQAGDADSPVEVQLYVSTDDAQHWHLAQSAEPAQHAFAFRAPGDGVYWFSIQTVDRGGRRFPKTHRPGLKVLVDTRLPELSLTAQRGRDGEVQTAWQAVDPNLDPKTLKIEYRGSPDALWQPLALERSGTSKGPNQIAGEATWWPAEQSDTITLRAEVFDRAGNRAVSHAQVEPLADASPATRPSSTAVMHRLPTDYADGRWPPDEVASLPLERELASQTFAKGTGPSRLPTINPTGPANHFVGFHREQDATKPQSPATPNEPKLIVNSRRFDLDYSIVSADERSLAKVELWGTKDNGRTWMNFGVDHNNRSPFEAQVEEDGWYGFRIVPTGNRGLQGERPASGDPPEVWVTVDTQRPTVELLQPELLTGNVTIRWEATDENPAPGGVTLEYASNPGGPWAPIASGLDYCVSTCTYGAMNAPVVGHYDWNLVRAPSDLPARVYLRITVRDLAGNVSTATTVEAVTLARNTPQGAIHTARAVYPTTRY